MRFSRISVLFLGVLLCVLPSVMGIDVQVWQGQYHTGSTFNVGTFPFNFTVFDDVTGGVQCYSNTTSLTTDVFGMWRTNQHGILENCSNASIDYYLNINIEGIDQTPRRMIKGLKYCDASVNSTFQEEIVIMGYGTGNVLNNDIDLRIGNNGFGALQLGNVQMFQSNLVVDSLDVNGTFITRHLGGGSNVRFAWIGADNMVRLAIPQEGVSFGLYNPRSEMIGGVLGQAFNNGMINCSAQGYRFIDCDTDLTGADLGLQDDFEFHGSLFGGNGTWNVTDDGVLSSLNLSGSYSNGEAFLCVDDDGRVYAKDSTCV